MLLINQDGWLSGRQTAIMKLKTWAYPPAEKQLLFLVEKLIYGGYSGPSTQS